MKDLKHPALYNNDYYKYLNPALNWTVHRNPVFVNALIHILYFPKCKNNYIIAISKGQA